MLVPEQAVGAAVENLSQGAMRVEAHSDVAVGGEVEISSKNSEVNVTALESQAETKITVTDGTVKKIDAAGAQVVVAESAQAGDVVAEKLENNGTVTRRCCRGRDCQQRHPRGRKRKRGFENRGKEGFERRLCYIFAGRLHLRKLG